MSLIPGYRYWIGLQINGQNANWLDGSPYTYTNLNMSTIVPGQTLNVYLLPGTKWDAVSASTTIEGRICKRPAIPNMPSIHNGSALGYFRAHDPTILKTQDGSYLVYETNENIPGLVSSDRQTFSLNGTAFPNGLPWTKNWTQGQKCYWTFDEKTGQYSLAGDQECLWCPDTSYHNGQYYMYYAAYVLYKNFGAIGLATSPTGYPETWTDHGMVFNSEGQTWNAIDPNLFVDDDGKWYVTFGSFNSGIWQYEMDPMTGFIKDPKSLTHLANERDGGIEASGLWKHGDYYYLANANGNCCIGNASTYRTIINRATSPKGPFYDKAGTPALEGGGSELMASVFLVVGPGGTYTFHDTDKDLLVYHYYDGLNNGLPRLGINYLGYTDDGWPYVY